MAEYIERERLLRKFNIDDMMNVNGTLISLRDAREVISSFPAADVAPVQHGRWIEKTAPAVHKYYECSKCGAHENKHTAIKGRYCWRCGAKMDGAE